MYCPKCRMEYREGFTQCSDCDVKLVDDLPPPRAPEYENMVTVFEGDSSSAAVARATVEGVGIESWVKDEEVHGLFPSLGSTEILVCEEDEQSAVKALETPDHCARAPHSSGHSTARQPRSTPSADNRFGAQRKESSSTRGKQSGTSEKGRHIKDLRRQGKRV